MTPTPNRLREMAHELARRNVWTDAAAAVNRTILEHDRSDVLAWARLARCHEVASSLGMAMACWERAAEARPHDSVTRAAAATHLEALRAKLAARRVAAGQPEPSDFERALAQARVCTGEERARAARKLVELARTPRTRSFALVLYGASARRIGQHDVAERAYRAAIRDWHDNPAARTGLAAVLVDRGLLDDAEGLCREVLEGDPENPYALQVLGRIGARRRPAAPAACSLGAGEPTEHLRAVEERLRAPARQAPSVRCRCGAATPRTSPCTCTPVPSSSRPPSSGAPESSPSTPSTPTTSAMAPSSCACRRSPRPHRRRNAPDAHGDDLVRSRPPRPGHLRKPAVHAARARRAGGRARRGVEVRRRSVTPTPRGCLDLKRTTKRSPRRLSSGSELAILAE